MGSIGKPFCHLADRAYTALSQFKVIISSRSKKCHGIMTNRAYSVYAIAKLGYFSSLLKVVELTVLVVSIQYNRLM